MQLFKKISLFFIASSFLFSWDAFAKPRTHEEGKKTISTKPRKVKKISLSRERKKSRIEKKRTSIRAQKKAQHIRTQREISSRQPVSALKTATGRGPLSQKLSKYYEDRGYRPGQSGNFKMTGRDIYLGADRSLHKMIPGFNEKDIANSVKKSYDVPHEKVTRILNAIRSSEAASKPSSTKSRSTKAKSIKSKSTKPRSRKR